MDKARKSMCTRFGFKFSKVWKLKPQWHIPLLANYTVKLPVETMYESVPQGRPSLIHTAKYNTLVKNKNEKRKKEFLGELLLRLFRD